MLCRKRPCLACLAVAVLLRSVLYIESYAHTMALKCVPYCFMSPIRITRVYTCVLAAVLCCAVYDVTRRETLSSLSGSWMQELQMYDPHPEVARMVVANKV